MNIVTQQAQSIIKHSIARLALPLSLEGRDNAFFLYLKLHKLQF
jgi:hypothetical protein